jgi:hypothetical protein
MATKKSDINKANIATEQKARNLKRKDTLEPMKQHNFRMKDSEYRRLQEHFEDIGLTIGAGIRMVLKEYMNRKRI